MLDPAAQTYRHARQEAGIVLTIWLIALIWTVGYCYIHGYQHAADNPLVQVGLADEHPGAIHEDRFGMPKWVCWGIFMPAVVCSLFTLVFGLFIMKDDPLGAENEEAPS
jgi:hypothetical protein